MNAKHQKYIEYIAKDIELPYLKSLNMYGLKQVEMNMVLSKVFNQPITIGGRSVYDNNGNKIYYEVIDGSWERRVYNKNDNKIYSENSDGSWSKYEYDQYDNETYHEASNGFWVKIDYDTNGNETYYENSSGYIEDNR